MPSTAIRDIVYDPETQRLEVTFVASGRRYAYLRVPIDAYDALRQAPSKGRHFNAHIRDAYDYVLVRPGSADIAGLKRKRAG